MHGQFLHNYKAEWIRTKLIPYPVQVRLECRIQRNGMTAYFDLLLQRQAALLAIEIETSARHIDDTAIKAAVIDIPLWIVVPTRRIRKQAQHKLAHIDVMPGGEPIKLLLLGQVEKEVMNYLSLFITANSNSGKMINKSKNDTAAVPAGL
jgi:hypothetical protein